MKRLRALDDFLDDCFFEEDASDSAKKSARARVTREWPKQAATPAHHAEFSFDINDHDGEAEVEPAATRVAMPRKKDEAEPDITAKEFYSQFIARTEAQCRDEAAAPQRSAQWKDARRFCITASDFGAAIGSNPYSSPTDLVKKKLWETFVGNAATRWGTAHEPHAEEAFLAWARENVDPEAELFTLGLTKWSAAPWIGVSPDGILLYKRGGQLCGDLVEYKCPTRAPDGSHPYVKYPSCTPPYYRHQMLGIWGLYNTHGGVQVQYKNTTHHLASLQAAWFVVWQPKTLWIVQHEFSMSEWQNDMFPKLRAWYFTQYLPALVWNYNWKLEHGDTEPMVAPIEVETETSPNMEPSPTMETSPNMETTAASKSSVDDKTSEAADMVLEQNETAGTSSSPGSSSVETQQQRQAAES